MCSLREKLGKVGYSRKRFENAERLLMFHCGHFCLPVLLLSFFTSIFPEKILAIIIRSNTNNRK